VDLGESGQEDAITELLELGRHGQPAVRRAVASALGKLAVCEGAGEAVPLLCELARDIHPQVRQYAMLALGKIGDETALPTLKDASLRPSEPEYNLRAALRAIEQIETAARLRRETSPMVCSRCGRETTVDEQALSQAQFQRVYCNACFDAVFIERRNFDMKVQNQKTILAADRTVVQSAGERRIADWLSARGIGYRYDDKFQIIQGYAIRPDFYLPRFDVYIEYWGLDTTDYKIGMLLKQKLYQQEGKKLVSLYPADLPHLDTKLGKSFDGSAIRVESA
jgi:transposase-like protein